MNYETPLLITGMHRSGTSLVANFVHHSGVCLGDDLVKAKPSNPYGHYEDVEILEFQRSILLREFRHSMWVPEPPRLLEEDRVRARDLIRARQRKPHWGWKEPRTSLFLDFWNDLLPKAYYLFVVRHPLLVVDSLRRRSGTRIYHIGKNNRFLQQWLIYSQECLRFHQQVKPRCLLVMIENVLQEPERFAALLTEHLGLEFSGELFRKLYDPSVLAHSPSQQLLVSPRLHSESVSLFSELQRIADL